MECSFQMKLGSGGGAACKVVLPLSPEGQARPTVWLGKGVNVLKNRNSSAIAVSPFFLDCLSPEVCVAFGSKPCAVVCRLGHANPSDMHTCCRVQHRKCCLDRLGVLKRIVLVLPVSFEACAECPNHPEKR
uniref:Uncharacterized protein n=1 Tax=Colobus angolensis palliatus TaxID=336983 RepID=A0A2K5IRQ6_COLAP